MAPLASVSTFGSRTHGPASTIVQAPVAREARAPLWELFAPGTLVELSGQAPGKLSTLARLVGRAQGQGELVAWVAAREGAGFYPPDFARVGVDLGALAVVRVPRTEKGGAHSLVRATEVLLRSGAFGMVVLDLSHEVPRGELSWQSRLSGLVRMHEARLVLLTASRPEEPSLGPLVSLRVASQLEITPGGRAMLSQRLLKTKLGPKSDPSPDVRALPEGLV
jgi:recombination protein RecA